MSKNKYIVIGGLITVLLVGGGVFAYMRAHAKKPVRRVAGLQTLGNATGSDSISLSELNSQSQSDGGLSVSQNSGAAALGQIGGNSSNQQATGSGGTSSESSKQSNPFDPSTYAQYEKYKNDQSGLFAEALIGKGAELTEGKKAAVFYKGWLTNGQVFDQSRPGEDGQLQPFVFTLGSHQVIPGWEQALAGMKVGGVRLVIVPPAAGYGSEAQNGIPANSVLIFQVQLAAVE